MSEYPTFPGQAESPKPGPPESVQRAVWAIWGLVGLSVISTLIGFLTLGDVVDDLYTETGNELSRDALQTAAVVGIILGLVITVGFGVLFAVLIQKGFNWARIVFTVLAAIFLLVSLLSLLAGGGFATVILTFVQIVLLGAAIFFLWRPDASAFFKSASAR